jgi:hypothetical protein
MSINGSGFNTLPFVLILRGILPFKYCMGALFSLALKSPVSTKGSGEDRE